jgi:hypothetical protein
VGSFVVAGHQERQAGRARGVRHPSQLALTRIRLRRQTTLTVSVP